MDTHMAAPRTVPEAQAQGWEGLEARMACCWHGAVQVRWTMLGRLTRRSSLAEIAARAVCEKCGAPAVSVALHRSVPGQDRGAPTTERLVVTGEGVAVTPSRPSA